MKSSKPYIEVEAPLINNMYIKWYINIEIVVYLSGTGIITHMCKLSKTFTCMHRHYKACDN